MAKASHKKYRGGFFCDLCGQFLVVGQLRRHRVENHGASENYLSLRHSQSLANTSKKRQTRPKRLTTWERLLTKGTRSSVQGGSPGLGKHH